MHRWAISNNGSSKRVCEMPITRSGRVVGQPEPVHKRAGGDGWRFPRSRLRDNVVGVRVRRNFQLSRRSGV